MKRYVMAVRGRQVSKDLRFSTPDHITNQLFAVGLLLLFLLGVLPFQGLNAQQTDNYFEHLSVQNGLSHNSINCIHQDREGFLWFGTYDGLNKHDGYNFTVFQPDPANPNHSFQSNKVTGLCEDHTGRLWAVTEGGGLHEVDKRTGRVTPHPVRVKNASRWNNQLFVCEDRQGILWISAYGGLIAYNPGKRHFRLYPSPKNEVPVKRAFEDHQNRLWVSTGQGLYQFNRQTGRFTPLYLDSPAASQPTFNAFYLDEQDRLWLGTAGSGVFQINLRSQPLRIVPFNPGGLINKYVFLDGIHCDADGDLWIGTTDGLQRVNLTSQQVVTYRPDPNNPNGLSSPSAQAVFHDRSGTLWVGTSNGIDKQITHTKHFTPYKIKPSKGAVNLFVNKIHSLLVDHHDQVWLTNQFSLHRLDEQKQQLTELPLSPVGFSDQYQNYIFALLPDGPLGIWLGTRDGLYQYNASSKQYTRYPADINAQLLSRGPTGDIWLGGESGIASFNPRTHQYTYYKYKAGDTAGLPDKFVYSLLASRSGDVWVGINGKGVSRLNPATGQFTHYTAGPRPGQLNNNEVLTFYEDPNGIIWAGTNQGGLNRIDPKTGYFSPVTTQDGLPSNRVVAIAGDKAGNLWLSTNRGLCRYNPRTKAVRSYDINDGLPSNDFVENAVVTKNNRLYFGSRNGYVRFNPDSIRDDTRPFPLYVTKFKVLDRDRPLTDSVITLRHDENFLSFEFAALAYVMPERNRYAYQLVGVDNNWIQSGTRRFVSYTSLPPDDYVFRMKAANSDGIWNSQSTSLHIRILPPWWKTWWAYTLYVLALVGSIWGFIRYRSRQLRIANRLLEETVAVRTAEVSQQRNEIARQRDSLEKTLSELTSAQRQLIQKEKMASLGELTAGIAHEIQNPLNFVNNFSAISVELVEEMTEELQAGHQNDALDLADLLGQNLRKITHHGQRADAIIKGMLQHSRTSTGQKDPTDLNSLANEYLRLAYHGLRAKDKSFNARLVTEFDPNLGLIPVVAQDIGRVLLNLFNNAFYAVSEKQKRVGDDYQPEVMVSTRRTDYAIEICVHDNGIGISQTVLDKIYQPFFTTKPTGQGTGLGLSLSYDIITKGHGGELTVQTEEGKFAEFIIKFPLPA
ncbi:hybrid sensor histidine kinase/response regulator [Spirosoma taeanense]|uniref:histidine kinase n=1 Tax=Spirosoma taeanense TaxID=2735870 RepID=A0A6M5Y157_9BACT|nr:two-component regulator propeller domain-containing protein [Spirosoma taeanense]QJW88488.1 hybrid sensor histidine kinase/response regulator [Spirosoma taeanense]